MSSDPDTQKQPPETTPAAESGSPLKMLGKYQILKKLGVGGMGAVYLATDTQLGRTVALKVLPRERARNPILVKRFHAEARAAAQLRHDNIVMIFEAGELEGYLFIALEYVEGADVFHLVGSRGPLPVRRSIDVVRQVARALAHAHSRSIVHRDIKPSNLLITREGTVKLTDMGLARTVDDTIETGITRAGTTVGTVDYMAPEQARDSRAADIRSDIYSLGCTWYQMLTGQVPFAEGSLTNKLFAHLSKQRPDPRDLNDSIPEALVAVMHKMMARKPRERYQTPAEVLTALDELEEFILSGKAALRTEEIPVEEVTEIDDANFSSAVDTQSDMRTSTPDAIRVPGRPRRSSPAARAKPSPAPLAAVAAIVAVLLIGVAVWGLSRRGSDPADQIVEPGGPGAAVPAVPHDVSPSVPPHDGMPADPPAVGVDSPPAVSTPATSTPAVSPPNKPPATVPAGPPVGGAVAGFQNPFSDEAVGRAAAPRGNGAPGRDGEQAYLPAWLSDVPTPQTVESHPRLAGLPRVTVGRTTGEPAQFADLRGAFASLPAEGGVVQLVGAGPFPLEPMLLENRGEVVLVGDPGATSLIVLQPATSGQPRARHLLAVRRTRLTLLNLHLSLNTAQFDGSDPLAAVDAEESDVVLRQVSVSMSGERPGRTAAVRFSGAALRDGQTQSERQPRLLLDRVLLRGNRLSAIRTEGASLDAAVVNCLLLSGGAPVLSHVDGNSTTSLPSLVRLVSTTCVVSESAFSFETSADLGERAPNPVAVLLLNSLLAVNGGGVKPAMIQLANWPEDPARASSGSQFANLIVATRSVVCTGWSNLLQVLNDPRLTVQGTSGWQRVWRQPQPDTVFQAALWPSSAIADYGSLAPADLAGEVAAAVRETPATDGGAPGALLEKLALPDEPLLEHSAALARLPQTPAFLRGSSSPPAVVRVDLNSDDLGRVIGLTDWADGTLFIAHGSGLQTSSPIHVKDRSLRIHFEQDEGLPLVLSARAIDPKLADRLADEEDGFFAITRGHLEISGATLRIPRSTRQPYPKWLIRAHDASFAIRGCQLQGPTTTGIRYQGLIGWSTSNKKPDSGASAGFYRHYGEIRDSYLCSDGELLQAEMTGCGLVVANSVLVGLEDVFDLNIVADAAEISSAVSLESSTLSARDAFFNVRATTYPAPSQQPLLFYVSATVFAPPVPAEGGARSSAALFDYIGPIFEQRQIAWWGGANAWSSEIAHLLRSASSGTRGTPQDVLLTFTEVWGEGRCRRPLSGEKAVQLGSAYPAVTRLGVSDFQLAPEAPAMRWSDDGQPLGADIPALAKRFAPE